jgi:ABC-type Na+ transport system ATPase subunit NatA
VNKKGKIYLFYNTVLGLKAVFIKRFKDQLMELTKENKLVLYFSTNIEVKSGEALGYSIWRYDHWNKWVDDTFKQCKENKKEEQP